MSDPVNIAEPLAEIFHRLGLDPAYVARLDIRPREARAELEVYLPDASGAKYVVAGEPAMETRTFEVST